MTRASMLAVLASDFVRTARASGLDNRTIIFTYAFRNAMLPVVTTLGMVFSFLLGANVLVEKVFAWPGIGSYAVEALLQSDFAPVQGFVLAMAILYVALNLHHRHSLRRHRSAREAGRMNESSSIIRQAAAKQSRRAIRCCAMPAMSISENPVTGFAFALFLLIALCALIGPYIVPYDPLASGRGDACCRRPGRTGSAPTRPAATSSAAWWWRRGSISSSRITSVALVFAMGGFAGIAAGFFGGWTDRIVGRISDTIMAFPLFVLAMGIVAALGNTVTNIVIATAIINFPLYVRVARAEANVRRDAGFVQAARLSGNGDFRILLMHILPNIMPIMMVQISLTMGYAILNAAGLSFIGLGVKPPTPEWGIMVAEGAGNIISGEWWIALFPGAALMLAVFCFNLLGDGLRDLVDPQRRT